MEKREPSYTVGGNANQCSHYGEQCGDSLKNQKQNCLMTQQPHCGHTHQGNQNLKRHVDPNVHHSTVYNSQDMEATQMSISRWIRKLWYIYTMEYYSAIKKNALKSVLMMWMKLEPIIQSEVSQKEEHQYSILMHVYGIQKDDNGKKLKLNGSMKTYKTFQN